MAELKDCILDVLYELDDSDMVSVHNEYCERNSYWDDLIYYMAELDYNCEGMKPTEVINRFSDVNTSDRYYHEGVYGSTSFNYYDDCPVTFYEEIAEYCAYNEDDLWNTEIRNCIDEWLEEQKEPEYESEEDAAWNNGGEETAMEHYYEEKYNDNSGN